VNSCDFPLKRHAFSRLVERGVTVQPVTLLCTLCTLNFVQHLKYNNLTCESYNYCFFGASNVLWKVASAVAGRKPLRAMAARSCKRTGYTVASFMYLLNIANH
jgi:hypothetical protein